MGLRGFLARHRIASAMAAPVALGVAAATTAWFAFVPPPSPIDTQLTSSVTECHDMVTVSIAGRSDTPVAGTTKMLVDPNGNALPAALSGDYSSPWIDQVVNAPNAVNTPLDPNAYAAVYIAYPANMDSYETAVDTGVANTESVMRQIRQSCPNTRFSVVGYSEGADVARRVAMDIGHQDGGSGDQIVDPANVVGVVIFADAGRAAGQGPFPGATDPFSNPDGFDRPYQTGTTATPGSGAVTGTGGADFGALAGRVASFCSDGDLTCSAPKNISLLQLAINVGRQLNIDALQRDGFTPAAGQDVAVVLGRVGYEAFRLIRSQPDWMQSDQTFLDVLLQVSDPAYKPGQDATTPLPAQSISADEMSPLAYLPKKVFNEIIGLIVTNQNTIPVVMSDPYQLTLGPDTGHHFDYWRDTSPGDGKPLTSAEYAAQWLTHLAQQAQEGKPVVTPAKPSATTPAPTTTTTTTTITTTTTESTATSATATTSATTDSATDDVEKTTAPATTTAGNAAATDEIGTSPTSQESATATTAEAATTKGEEAASTPSKGVSGQSAPTTTVAPTPTPTAAAKTAG